MFGQAIIMSTYYSGQALIALACDARSPGSSPLFGWVLHGPAGDRPASHLRQRLVHDTGEVARW